MSVSLSNSSIFFKGEEDVDNAGPRRLAIRHCLRNHPAEITIDLSDTNFLDASAVTDLVHLANYLGQHGGILVLRKPSRPVYRLLQIAGLPSIESVKFVGLDAPINYFQSQQIS